jgi:arylsulfatase A-like enzyme
VAASAIYTAGSRPARRKRAQAMRLAATIAVSSVLLAVFARAVEPRPHRAVPSLQGYGPTHASSATARPRVLVLAIDGLDWGPLEYLGQRGQLPTLRRIVERGRSYQVEAGGLSVSPPIWTAIYTGSASRRNMVGGYTQWRFAGLPHPIWFFPEFDGHPLLMLDTLLDRTQPLGLWRGEPTSTGNIQDPTMWEIASGEGRRVGVFDPTPFPARGEIVNGRFTWRRSDRYIVEDGDGDVSHPHEIRAEMPTMYADSSEIFSTERARARVAIETIGPDQDLAIYYTSVLDWLGHRHWDAVQGMGDSFDRTPVAAGYRLVDEVASTMIAAFGRPAAVVLISDHGWEFSEYEHFNGPNGVLVVSGAGPTGYGGTAHILDVAPTVLSLLQLPTATTMRTGLADVAPQGSARRYTRTHPRRFVEAERPQDKGRSDLLRTLGYISR